MTEHGGIGEFSRLTLLILQRAIIDQHYHKTDITLNIHVRIKMTNTKQSMYNHQAQKPMLVMNERRGKFPKTGHCAARRSWGVARTLRFVHHGDGGPKRDPWVD